MSLIKCPECGKEVSDHAESCPNCGFSLKPHKTKNNIVIGVIAGIFGVIAIVVIISGIADFFPFT